MSPEYAMDGLFSIKSDVFSFGVLVLEIISGKKNRGFYYSNNELNLLGHVSKKRHNLEKKTLDFISFHAYASLDSLLTEKMTWNFCRLGSYGQKEGGRK